MIELALKSGDVATIQYHHASALIMLHSDDISAQWSPNRVGVELMHHGDLVKLGFHNVGSAPNYQSFHFEPASFYKMYDFFKALGFPLNLAKESLNFMVDHE